MKLTSQELLAQLGRGNSIQQVCQAADISREQFDAWWRDECRRRITAQTGVAHVPGLKGTVTITRDQRGMPHITADSDADLFFGLGYATAQDRLFQLDYGRRKARGRLAEILGAEAIESDRLYRTLDLSAIAATEWSSLPNETQTLLSAYSAGINALIESASQSLPIEFDLLEYRPAAWSPTDSLVIVGDFRWYLTGRFPVIVVPELVKRALGDARGDGPLYRAFLAGEIDDECILPAGSYPRRSGAATVSSNSGDEAGPGSNNWVLAGTRTDTKLPLVASDPHVPFGAVSIWHEVHLRGESFQVGGVTLVGMPAILIGRNERTAWGITNNICSQRDLYQERTDPTQPGCFQFAGQWEPGRKREETIVVRNAAPVNHAVISSRNGPLVDQLLPPAARATGPVSLRWLGFEPCGWLPAVLAMNRARSVAEIRASLRPWRVPTFNVVCADVDGHIAYQCSGSIPLRHISERGYRPGWDQAHQWDGLIPFEGMPYYSDPAQGFIVTANHRVAPPDYTFPLSGTWVTGYRARRIRQQIEATAALKRTDHQRLQLDVYSGRAAACVPALVKLLAGEQDARGKQAVRYLQNWDFHVRPDSVAAALFNVFFGHWCRVVTADRLPQNAIELVATMAGPLAVQLLPADRLGWFVRRDHRSAVLEAWYAMLDELANRMGPDMEQWAWGRLHVLLQKHLLSARGELGRLLDQPSLPLGGDGHTVNSSTPDPNHAAWLGAGYRMLADLSDPQAGWWSIEVGSTSGQPGSEHYGDQLDRWYAGELVYTPLQGPVNGPTLQLVPRL